MYQQKADSELLDLLRQDVRAAFDTIYHRHWERLYAIAYSRTENVHASEDIVQDVFVSLWNNRTNNKIDKLENYLATAIMYQTLRYLQKERRTIALQQGDLPELSTEITAVHILDNKNLLQLIEDETSRLPEQCQLIFRKSREQHMTVQEIARELNISPNTVTNQLTKALGRLRKSLKSFFTFSFLGF